MKQKTSFILITNLLQLCLCFGVNLSADAIEMPKSDPFAYSVQNDLQAAQNYLHKIGHNAEAAKLYQQAAELINRQKVKQANTLLDEALKLDERQADFYSSKGYCQLWMGTYQPGIESMKKAIAMDSTKPIYYYRKAMCHSGTFDQEAAAQTLDHILETNPNDINALRLQMHCLKSIDNQEGKAIGDCNRLIKINAYTVEALCQRGELLARRNQYDGALQDFETAQKLAPNDVGPYIGRANTLYKQGNYKLAGENYTAASVYSKDIDQINFCLVQKHACLQHLKQTPPAPRSIIYGPGVHHNNQ